jgi:hypothetical protein
MRHRSPSRGDPLRPRSFRTSHVSCNKSRCHRKSYRHPFNAPPPRLFFPSQGWQHPWRASPPSPCAPPKPHRVFRCPMRPESLPSGGRSGSRRKLPITRHPNCPPPRPPLRSQHQVPLRPPYQFNPACRTAGPIAHPTQTHPRRHEPMGRTARFPQHPPSIPSVPPSPSPPPSRSPPHPGHRESPILPPSASLS